MKKKSYDCVKDWRRNTKIKLFQAFGGKCGNCSVVDDPVIYDIHHLDEDTKEFSVANKIRSWTKIAKEAAKCAMLCAPCHRKHHAGLLILSPDIQQFDEVLIDIKTTSIPCKVCEVPISLGRKTCSYACASKLRGHLDWDQYDLQALLIEYKNPFRIGQIIGVSDNSVRRALKKAGLLKK
jgi:hypothetical protein